MKAFVTLVIGIFLAIGIGVAIESTPHSSPALTTLEPKSLSITIPASGPCPNSIRTFRDVANEESNLDSQLLPANALFGIICRYGERGNSEFALIRTALINGRTARKFDAIIRALNNKVPTGLFNCPAQFAQATILSFGFADRQNVDLWYEDSGCQTLDNGFIRVYETENPQFIRRFIPLVTLVAP